MSATLTTALLSTRGPGCFDGAPAVTAFVPRASLHERYFPPHLPAAELRSNAAHICRELEIQRGERLEARPGCRIDRMAMGIARVPVEWSYTRPERCSGIEGGPVIEAVFVNGMWVADIADCFADRQIQEWADEASRLLASEREEFMATQEAA